MIRLLNSYNYRGDILPAGTELTLPNEDKLVENGVAEKIELDSEGPNYKLAAEGLYKENEELKRVIDNQAQEIYRLYGQIDELKKPTLVNSQAPENIKPTEEITPVAEPAPTETPGRVIKK